MAADAAWNDEEMLAQVRREVLPVMEKRGPVAAWTIAWRLYLPPRRTRALYWLQEHEMNDELQDLRNVGYKPVIVGPQPFSFEDLMRSLDPAPDEETERFVAAIYADRRPAVEDVSSE